MAASIFDRLKKNVKGVLQTSFSNAGGVKSDSDIRKANPKTLSADERKRLARLNR